MRTTETGKRGSMIQDLPTNFSNGQLSGNVEYIEHDDETWSFRLTIYVSEEAPILIESTSRVLSKGDAKEQARYALDIESERRKPGRTEFPNSMRPGRL
jgi:hypothetical protein